jgi:hypothetical protein
VTVSRLKSPFDVSALALGERTEKELGYLLKAKDIQFYCIFKVNYRITDVVSGFDQVC